MKRIFVLVLALVLALLVVACDQSGTGNPSETTGGGNNPGPNAGETTGAGGPSSDATDPDGSGSSEEGEGPEDPGPTVPSLLDGTVVNETVYLSVESAYYRSAPDEYEDNLVASVAWGAELNRVCYNSDWSIILLNEEYYYLPTDALSKTEPASEDREEFTAVSDTVTVTGSDVMLRTAPISSDITGYISLEEGDSLVRVKYSDGWSIVVYQGLELYIEIDLHSGSQGSIDDVNFNNYEGTVTVTANTATLYTLYTTDLENSEVIATPKKGETMVATAVSEDGTWYRVEYMDPSTGRTLSLYVQASEVSATAS